MRALAVLRRELLFESLTDAQIRDIVVHDPVLSFGDDEAIVCEGEAGGRCMWFSKANALCM